MEEVIQNPQDMIFNSGRESVCRSWTVSAFGDDFPDRIQKAAEKSGTQLQRTSGKAVFLVDVPEGRFVLKKYWESQFFRYLFRPSQSLRELKGYRLAAELQLPAARVVACGDLRCSLRLKEDFIITEFLEGSRSGREFASNGELKDQLDLRNFYIQENIRRLAKLHDAGYTHGGAHPRNFLWAENGGSMKIMWIDLATVRRHPEGITLDEGFTALQKHFLSKFDLTPENLQSLHELYCDSRRTRL